MELVKERGMELVKKRELELAKERRGMKLVKERGMELAKERRMELVKERVIVTERQVRGGKTDELHLQVYTETFLGKWCGTEVA